MSNPSALQRSPVLSLYRFQPGTYCAFPNEETVVIVDTTLPKEYTGRRSESTGLSNSGQTGLHAVPPQWINKARTICAKPLTVKISTRDLNKSDSLFVLPKMRPDGISSSSEVVLEDQAPSPMHAASTGASSETPALPGPRATRGLGRSRGRDSQATSGGNAFCESSSVLQKGNTEMNMTQSNNGKTNPSQKELPTGTGRVRLLDPAPHV
jgi:hypothetical protein